ncbi:MAG: hypothetical protein COS76_00060 [Candidatus Portnoybacteria bacterium CG06_land_8_20_14_3_00_39_12]|uniref:N-acetyltransferase domain-containing protein n=1 Tax=Candidatus Portnoybacteria bacterium CG06_land_8_20_14_3_00_39_12 TaxID=1974809 RepID=A0A2M7AY48_9BACT|nr:MAG: hypothetical protein COS76_00060 [Candidatus Portnoybacteria bacterium CG06_land_8_20_14_3_00_39_12]
MNGLEGFFKSNDLAVCVKDWFIWVTEEPKALFEKQENFWIIELVRCVAADSFGVEIEQKSFEGIRDHLANADLVSVAYGHGEIYGFASVRILSDFDIFFLHGVAIAKKFQSRGVGLKLISALLNRRRLGKIALTTQNPAMFCLTRKMTSIVYPSPEDKIVPLVVRPIGISLMKNRRGVFVQNTFIQEGLYSQCLYPVIPESNDDEVNSWFRESLKIENGITRNGFLFIGEFKEM